MKTALAWIWYVIVQILMMAPFLLIWPFWHPDPLVGLFLCCLTSPIILGWILLIPFCIRQAWTADSKSIKDQRVIDRWNWKPLNWIWGNPEDGVSGQYALVWTRTGQVPYMAGADPAWRAYCWSAWRNSADALKYVFAWKNGPLLATFTLGGRVHKLGWQMENGYNVPVLS